MSLIEKVQFKVKALFRREVLDADLDEELRFHLDQHIAQLVTEGMDAAAARTEALRLFGGVEKFKEECRDERRVRLVDGFFQDVVYAARSLRKNKGYALLAALTLALGIGANTAIFSVVNGVVLSPLPYDDGGQLVLFEAEAPGIGREAVNFSILEFYEFRDEIDALDLVEYHGMFFTLFGHGRPSAVATGVVSHNFFDVLRVEAQLGRTFLPTDEAPEAEPVLVLSDRYWREEFAADPNAVGTVVEMNDRPHLIVGVLPPLPQYPRYNDVYMPTSACPYRTSWETDNGEPITPVRDGFRSLTLFGRLTEGSSVEEAHHAAHAMSQVQHERAPDYYAGSDYAASAVSLQAALTRDARPILWALIGTVMLVLLVACANVANLMVARVMWRDRELALRAAMGAGRGRLVRQLLTESTLLSLAGGVLGLVFAAFGLDLLIDLTGRYTQRAADISIDGWVLTFTFVIAVLTGIAAGVLPGMWANTDVVEALRESAGAQATRSRRASRIRAVLTAGQVALSFMLLIGAGLMINSFVKLSTADTGFGAETVITADVLVNWSEYPLDGTTTLFGDLLEGLEGAPGVVSAAVSNSLPYAGATMPDAVYVAESRHAESVSDDDRARLRASSGEHFHGWPLRLFPFGISARYFETLGIPIVEGRTLTATEIDAYAPVGLLSESARNRFWPDRSPIGEKIALADDMHNTFQVFTIVGVVADAKHFGLDQGAPPALFASYRNYGGAGQLLVKTTEDVQTMTAVIQETAARVAPRQPIENFQTVGGLRAASLATPRLATSLISLFAVLALVITVAGIGGVVAFSVAQRTREIGIRMALGAERRSVLGSVVRQGLSLVVAGLVAGAAGAVWFGSLLSAFLYETEPTDVLTFLGVALVLILAALAACWVPARRATSIDPVVALRSE